MIPTRKLLLLASVAFYVLALALPAMEGQYNPGDLQLLHYYPDCEGVACRSVTGFGLSIAGLEGLLFFGQGFADAFLAETCWLANPLFLSALGFLVASRPRTAARLSAAGLVAALLILLPGASHSKLSGTLVGLPQIGYWCWLASLCALLAASIIATRQLRVRDPLETPSDTRLVFLMRRLTGMPTRRLFPIASVALYILCQALPAIHGSLGGNDAATLPPNQACGIGRACDSTPGWLLSFAGLWGVLFLGQGFRTATLLQICWLANPLFLSALVFLNTKSPRTAAGLSGCAVICALVMLLPDPSRGQQSEALQATLGIGYWCWLITMFTLFVGSLVAAKPSK